MKIEKKKKNIEAFLNQSDWHIHSFSHCVLKKRGVVGYEDFHKLPLEEKLDYISKSIGDICEEAIGKGIKMIGIVEHPQFERYSVPYSEYLRRFNAVKKKVGRRLRMFRGLEFDLSIREDGEFFLDRDGVSYGRESWEDVVENIDYVIGGVHYKQIKNDGRLSKRSFHVSAVKAVINELSELRRELGKKGKKKVFILGHPLAFMGEINRRFKHPDYLTFASYLESEDVAAKFLTKKNLEKISEMLYENKIYPEFNGSCIIKRQSDIRISEPYPTTLLETYIDVGLENRKKPLIIPSSDAHRVYEVGNLRTDVVKERIPKLDKAMVPYKALLR